MSTVGQRWGWFALLGLAACAKSPRALYVTALDAHTHQLVVQHNLGTALRLRGTYLSPDFRLRLAEERARLLGSTPAARQAFLDLMVDEGGAYHEIVFTAETTIVDAVAEFGESDDRWQIRLEADGTPQDLVTVYRVREPSALLTELYAHKNLWNELWVARFVRTVERPDTITLHVGSGYGHGELVFTGDEVR